MSKYKTSAKIPFTKHASRYKAHLSQEQLEQDQNLKYVISLDEVGWGSIAGPLGLGIAVLPVGSTLKVKDSKAYSSQKLREEAYTRVKAEALWSDVILIPASTLNVKGLARSKDTAMFSLLLDAIEHFSHKDSIIILDGAYLPKVLPSELKSYRVVAVPKADAKIRACSAASVLAKVEHDRVMDKYAQDPIFAPYEFEKNKGYGTPVHLEALKTLGATVLHRTNIKQVKDAIEAFKKEDLSE